MKNTAFLLFFSLLSLQLHADCSVDGLAVFPKASTISQNSHFILEGAWSTQELIEELNQKYPVYLSSRGGHQVKLKVLEQHKGLYRLTQALLMPEEKLIAGETYTLQINGLSKKDQEYLLNKWDPDANVYKPYSWTVIEGNDNQGPSWSQRPALVDRTMSMYGCGPAVFAHFELKTTDRSEVWIKTELVDLASNVSTTYYLLAEEGRLLVGHGMCVGAFNFNENSRYKIRFELVDACGNEGEGKTAWLTFDSPYDKS